MRLPIHPDQSGGTDEGSRIVHGVPNPLSKTGNHMHPPGGRELQEASGRRSSRDVFAQGHRFFARDKLVAGVEQLRQNQEVALYMRKPLAHHIQVAFHFAENRIKLEIADFHFSSSVILSEAKNLESRYSSRKLS